MGFFNKEVELIIPPKKQNSKNAIASYYSNQVDIRKTIPVINELTKTVVEAEQPKVFAIALAQHEIALSNILELPTVKVPQKGVPPVGSAADKKKRKRIRKGGMSQEEIKKVGTELGVIK